jgi:hypothetical protein
VRVRPYRSGRGYTQIMKMLLVALAAVAVLWSAFVVVKFSCHECLTLPMAAVCEHSFRGGTTDVQIESNRVGGYIKERQFAGCTFYWHENNT